MMLALWAPAASAGVWVREPGAGYVQVALCHQESGQVYLPAEGLVPQTDEALLGTIAPLFDDGRFAATDLGGYAEVGVGHGFEVYGSLPVRWVQNRWSFAEGSYPDIVQGNGGLGDLVVGGRFGRTWGGFAASAYAGARVPLYSNAPQRLNLEAGNSDFEDDQVPLGQGSFDLDVGGGVGYGLAHGWGLAEFGVRARTRQLSTAVPVRLQLGVKPIDDLAVWVGADLLASLGDGAAPDFYRDEWGKGPIVIDNASSLQLGAGGILEIHDGFGVIATLSHTVWGVRFPALTSATVGATWRFDSAP
jgi:hypothetical protein